MYVWKRVKLQISIPPDLLSLFFPFFTDCCPLGCHVPRSIISSPTARGQVILATDDSISCKKLLWHGSRAVAPRELPWQSFVGG